LGERLLEQPHKGKRSRPDEGPGNQFVFWLCKTRTRFRDRPRGVGKKTILTYISPPKPITFAIKYRGWETYRKEPLELGGGGGGGKG